MARSDGFLNFTSLPISHTLHYPEAIQSQVCSPRVTCGGARNVDDLYRTNAYLHGSLVAGLFCGCLLEKKKNVQPSVKRLKPQKGMQNVPKLENGSDGFLNYFMAEFVFPYITIRIAIRKPFSRNVCRPRIM